jgi:hypothetical protein
LDDHSIVPIHVNIGYREGAREFFLFSEGYYPGRLSAPFQLIRKRDALTKARRHQC